MRRPPEHEAAVVVLVARVARTIRPSRHGRGLGYAPRVLDLLSSPDAWISLLVLSAMEIVLGIDNIVFITILAGRLPPDDQLRARRWGLAGALISRLVLLLGIAWIMRLTTPLFEVVVPWSGKDLILLFGGLFLLYKATHEIYENVERPDDHQPEDVGTKMAAAAEHRGKRHRRRQFVSIIMQVMVLDIVFSLDSVITAVGMADHIPVMVVAMLIAVVVMMVFAGPIGDFIQRHPSVRVLALAFLLLIAVMLIIESTGGEVSKGYIYTSMGFSLLVQVLNMRMQSRRERAERELAKQGTAA